MQISILTRLGFEYRQEKIIVPSYRYFDVNSPIDLAEEIIRIYGYNNIKPQALNEKSKTNLVTTADWENQRLLANRLIRQGYSEVLTYSFVPKKYITDINPKTLVEVDNPLSEDYRYLRPSLIPLMVDAAEKNTWAKNISIFEIGNVFTNNKEETKIALVSTQPIGFLPHAKVIEKNNDLFSNRLKYYIWEGHVNEIIKIVPENNVKKTQSNSTYRNFSKLPPAVRDISLIIDKNISVEQVKHNIEMNKNVLVAELFDIFENEKIGSNKYSLAFRIILDNPIKTFTSAQTDNIINNITTGLIKEFQAQIR